MGKSSFRQNFVKGTAQDDVLEGGLGPDRLVGGAGNDRLIAAWDDMVGTPTGVRIYDGGQGTDWLDFSKLDRPIGVDLYFGPYLYLNYQRELYGDRPHYNPTPDDRLAGAISGIENLIGTEFSDYLQGSSGNNIIYGRGGNDYIASQRGTDVVVGGAGDDFIFLGSYFGTFTGDDDNDPTAVGNDIFYIGGYDVGIYATHRITDFDLKADEFDLSFDKFYFTSYQQITWGSNAAGELVAFRWAQGQVIGEVIFSGLTAEQAHMVPVYQLDYSVSDPVPVPYTPDFWVL